MLNVTVTDWQYVKLSITFVKAFLFYFSNKKVNIGKTFYYY